jgi:UrcA family protein
MSNRALQVAAFFTAAAVSGAVGATSAVYANAEQETVVVRYRRGDLDSSAGAEQLYQTLSRVARFACGDAGYSLEMIVRRSRDECEQTTLANAVVRVSSANLTTAYNGHFPNQPLVEKERLSERLRALIVLVVG